MNTNYSKLWEDYLLYAILKQVVKDSNALDEVARRFGCHPEQMLENECFWDRNSYDEIEQCGYIRFDEERGWLFGWKKDLPISFWDEVQFSKETTVGYEEFIQLMARDPEAVANTEFRVGMWQKAVDPEVVWSRDKVEVGGTVATVSYILDEETWKLLRLSNDVWIKKALIDDLMKMDADHAESIRRFLTDPLFLDSILSFLGFAATSGANIWKKYNRENMSLLVEEFNSAAIVMGCRTIRECDIKRILTFVGSRIGAFYDLDLDIPEVHPVLVVWSLQNRCSIWGPGETFLDMLPLIPLGTWVCPEALAWCMPKRDQAEMAQEILKRLNEGQYHRRHVEVLIALTVNSEPFNPSLQEAIMDYLFCKEPARRAFEKKIFCDLMGSGNMKESAWMKALSLLEMR